MAWKKRMCGGHGYTQAQPTACTSLAYKGQSTETGHFLTSLVETASWCLGVNPFFQILWLVGFHRKEKFFLLQCETNIYSWWRSEMLEEVLGWKQSLATKDPHLFGSWKKHILHTYHESLVIMSDEWWWSLMLMTDDWWWIMLVYSPLPPAVTELQLPSPLANSRACHYHCVTVNDFAHGKHDGRDVSISIHKYQCWRSLFAPYW